MVVAVLVVVFGPVMDNLYNNNSATAQKLSFVFGLMAVTNETMEMKILNWLHRQAVNMTT
jgi:hypothetical protein